jgi:hypothetical protein
MCALLLHRFAVSAVADPTYSSPWSSNPSPNPWLLQRVLGLAASPTERLRESVAPPGEQQPLGSVRCVATLVVPSATINHGRGLIPRCRVP